MTSSFSVPPPRQVLSSLFNQISEIYSDDSHSNETFHYTSIKASSSTQQTSSAVNHADQSSAACMLASASPSVRRIFITLHCLFSNELLPALDLLDRRLVRRLVNQPESLSKMEIGLSAQPEAQPGNPAPIPGPEAQAKKYVYYVRSSASIPRTGRFSHAHPAPEVGKTYEVRIKAWNCTCPAFAFASFFSGSGASSSAGTSGDASIGAASTLTSDPVSGKEDGYASKNEAASSSAKSTRTGHDFGGLGLGTGHVPVCKHLLACFLVECCAPLAAFVEEVDLDESEMAGWAAGWAD